MTRMTGPKILLSPCPVLETADVDVILSSLNAVGTAVS